MLPTMRSETSTKNGPGIVKTPKNAEADSSFASFQTSQIYQNTVLAVLGVSDPKILLLETRMVPK